jgi:hypothetical protein
MEILAKGIMEMDIAAADDALQPPLRQRTGHRDTELIVRAGLAAAGGGPSPAPGELY